MADDKRPAQRPAVKREIIGFTDDGHPIARRTGSGGRPDLIMNSRKRQKGKKNK